MSMSSVKSVQYTLRPLFYLGSCPQASVVMRGLSYVTETVLSNKITRNRIVQSFKESPQKRLRRRPHAVRCLCCPGRASFLRVSALVSFLSTPPPPPSFSTCNYSSFTLSVGFCGRRRCAAARDIKYHSPSGVAVQWRWC